MIFFSPVDAAQLKKVYLCRVKNDNDGEFV